MFLILIVYSYSKVYCIHINAAKKELVLYQLTKDLVVKHLIIDLHTDGAVFVHVIDNILLAHNIDQKVCVFIYFGQRLNIL